MSWISQNYEKVSIGAGVVVAAGLAFLGWSKLGTVPEDFNIQTSGTGATGTQVEGADRIPLTLSSLAQPRVWNQGMDGERPVDLFTGIPLFVKKDAPTKPLDLIRGAQIHPGIPNIWWLNNHLDLGFADAPNRDPDGDGFTNAEEFAAHTDPNDPKSHPSLIAKLRYIRDESIEWQLEPGFEVEAGAFGIKYGDSLKRQNRNNAVNPIKPGDIFFANPPAQGRFKFLSFEKREEENPRTHIKEENTFLKFEDQAPNKKGEVYEIPNRIAEGNKRLFSHFDRTAILSLEAIGESGKEFKVDENTAFALPSTAGKKEFTLKKVTPDGIEVEYKTASGETKTVPIPKGGMPATTP